MLLIKNTKASDTCPSMIVAVFLCSWRWRHLTSTIKNSAMSSACEKSKKI